MVYNDVNPKDLSMEGLKCLNSLMSFLAGIFLVRYYWACILFHRIELHLRKLKPLDVDVTILEIFMNPSLWVELGLILPHCPPFITMSIGVENMKNFSVYRIETIMAGVFLIMSKLLN